MKRRQGCHDDGNGEEAGHAAIVARSAGRQPAAPLWRIVWVLPGFTPSLIEFPADDPERARRFWEGLLGRDLRARHDREGEGWQTDAGAPEVGVHARGRGPGDSFSLPYFAVSDVTEAMGRVEALGGSVVHPGDAFAICKDSEGTPFGLMRSP